MFKKKVLKVKKPNKKQKTIIENYEYSIGGASGGAYGAGVCCGGSVLSPDMYLKKLVEMMGKS
jgi:hypothetical protein